MKNFILILSIITLSITAKSQDSIYIYQDNSVIKIIGFQDDPIFINPAHCAYRISGSNFIFRDKILNQSYKVGEYSEIFDIDTNDFASQALAITYLNTFINRSLTDVNIQDQTTDPILIKFNKIAQSTTLKSDRAIGDTFVTVIDTLGANLNRYVIVFNPDLLRFSKFNILSFGVSDTLFLDAPLDVAYESGSYVDLTSTNLAVDGSAATQTFGVRGVSPSPVGISVDITRIIFNCQTASAVNLAKFADLAALTNGLVLRKRDGRYFNIFNVKTNGDLAAIAYDWTPHAATNPQQGQDGFVLRLTFAGQNKIGVTVRLLPGEDLEFLVQDDLSGITLLEVVAEGHVVEK